MIKTFQDLRAWQKARNLTCAIYKVTASGAIARDFGYKTQLQRAAVSIMSNIAEGFGYTNNKQFRHYLTISRASACEVQSLLFVGLDASYLTKTMFDDLLRQTNDVLSTTSALKQSLK